MKYIIDIPDEVVEFVGSEMNIFIEPKIKTDGQRHYAFRLSNEDIAIYPETDRKAIEDEVWEFVKKIECLTIGETEDCFDIEYDGIPFVANMFSYQEAKAKYEAWEKQKCEICVGDEVIYHRNKYIVGYVGEDEVYHLVDQCWLRVVVQGDYQLIKTGKHFNEMEELLKKMREDT